MKLSAFQLRKSYYNQAWSGGANITRCLQRGAPAQLWYFNESS